MWSAISTILINVLKGLLPWIAGVASKYAKELIYWIINKIAKKKLDKIADENAKKLQESIDTKQPRQERQKAEENLLNS